MAEEVASNMPMGSGDFSWLLWPDSPGIPTDAPDLVAQDPQGALASDILDVHRPRLFCFRAAKPNGRAVLVLAGGGYTKLVVSYEGVDVAHWLNQRGFHAFVLVHRLPQARWTRGAQNGSQPPLDDAMEAMRQIRARAAEFDLKPGGLGVFGLSSGGHLAASLAAGYPADWRSPPSAHEHVSHRPDFLVVGYAPISTNAAGRTVIPDKPPLPPPEKQALYEALQPDARLLDNPPPVFLVYSAADPVVPVENAYRLAAAWRAKGGSAETHVYAEGAHGFALRETSLPIGQWPQACEQWLRALG